MEIQFKDTIKKLTYDVFYNKQKMTNLNIQNKNLSQYVNYNTTYKHQHDILVVPMYGK